MACRRRFDEVLGVFELDSDFARKARVSGPESGEPPELAGGQTSIRRMFVARDGAARVTLRRLLARRRVPTCALPRARRPGEPFATAPAFAVLGSAHHRVPALHRAQAMFVSTLAPTQLLFSSWISIRVPRGAERSSSPSSSRVTSHEASVVDDRPLAATHGRARLPAGLDFHEVLRHICRRAPGARRCPRFYTGNTMTLAGAQVHGQHDRHARSVHA